MNVITGLTRHLDLVNNGLGTPGMLMLYTAGAILVLATMALAFLKKLTAIVVELGKLRDAVAKTFKTWRRGHNGGDAGRGVRKRGKQTRAL